MRVRELFGRLIPGRIADATSKSRREAVRRIIGQCPVCMLNLDGHAYAELATVLTTDAAAQAEVLAAIEAGNWARLMAIQQWDPEADVVQCDAVGVADEKG